MLGSLIDPRAVEADLYQQDYESVRVLLAGLLRKEGTDDEGTERAVAAQGMARAAELLADHYHLVITNVPYLGRDKQTLVLREFAAKHHSSASKDLATIFVSRTFRWINKHGTLAMVTPRNWLFLASCRKLREELLRRRTWNLVAWLGPGAFETVSGHVVDVTLDVLSADTRLKSWRMAGIDVAASHARQPIRTAMKAAMLRGDAMESEELDGNRYGTMGRLQWFNQGDFLKIPDSIVSPNPVQSGQLLKKTAKAYEGLSTGDRWSKAFCFWETPLDGTTWEWMQDPPTEGKFSGRQTVVWKRVVEGEAAALRGRAAWQRDGVAFSQTGRLIPTRYTGEYFSDSTPVVVPNRTLDLAALWCFSESGALEAALRAINPKLSVSNGYFSKVPFDATHWARVAAESYPRGLPEPYSDDPTQWIFHGHPCGSVVWDKQAKWTSVGEHRIDATVLQVAVARLLGYRWPAEREPDMRLADEVRMWVVRCGSLEDFADSDGIVCLASVSGEPAAADRLRGLLAAAYGNGWSAATERRLLAAALANGRPPESIEEWLRDFFFEQHCQLFRHRPFIWHIWDGRRDGFHAVVNYHRLAGPNGEGRRTLEALTYRHLGDWIARQEGRPGPTASRAADGRFAAAYRICRTNSGRSLVGEPPCDLFVSLEAARRAADRLGTRHQ